MRYKWIYGLLALFVSALMLMPSVFACPTWIAQATLSPVDGLPSQDPENSGFGTTQVVVWEELNVFGDWDIWMSVSMNDGAVWGAPIIVIATLGVDEINPAVAVTNINPFTLVTEVHVVYQSANIVPPGLWDVCHTWTPIPIIAWSPPLVLDVMQQMDAIDPAIVYTEDLSIPGPLGMLVQFVWAEQNPIVLPLFYQIQYNAFYYDPTLLPPGRGYVGTTVIRASPFGNCMYPEIASVDETLTPAAYDYYFAVVWEEPTAPPLPQINVWYNDGTTTIFPRPPGTVLTPGSLGQLNAPLLLGDCYHPDIAATQDYIVAPGVETYYFHVNWVYRVPGPPITWQIDTCYTVGAIPTPGAAALALGLTAPAFGPVGFVLNNPTIATKLILMAPPPGFETWMCWEDNSVPASAPDIWYRVGQWNALFVPPFVYTVPAAIVPYMQPVGSSEYNPELWNRNDFTRLFPPLTHLVFDMTQLGAQEVEYIDP